MRPSLAIHLVSGGMHATAGLLVLLYSAILRSGFPAAEKSPAVFAAGKYYLVSAILLAGALRHYSVRTCIVSYLEEPSEKRFEKFQRFPLYQAFNSLFVWLLAVPVLGFVGLRVDGAVHPVRFPHFCLSVLFAGLLTSVYSTVFHTALVCQLSKSHAAEKPKLLFASRVIPWAAFLIPVLVCIVYVGFEKPDHMQGEAYRRLGQFFSFLILLSGYGWVFCDLTARNLRAALGGSLSSH